MENIVAIATPAGAGGISVIRISGENAIEIADKVFKSKSGILLKDKKGYTASFGGVYDCNHGNDNDLFLDEAIATVFIAPHSYTGENVVELSCHGGIYSTNEVLRTVIKAGATLAGKGEFTKRAFMNGKLTLTQAEAVRDLINAENKQALITAHAQKEGALYKKLDNMYNQMLKIAGNLAVFIDYPEEDIDEIQTEDLLIELKDVSTQIGELVRNFDKGKLIREGIETVIIGKPNVGKSTLMNLLAGYQKSIVTDIAGTTRDIVEEVINLGDLTLRLSDTAGIHETDDIIEQKGVELALNKLKSANLVLAVFDNSSPFDKFDLDIIEKISDLSSVVAIINKSDLDNKIDMDKIQEKFKNIVSISAKNEENISKLEQVIKEIVDLNSLDPSQAMLLNNRQYESANTANESIIQAIDAINMGMTFDVVGILVEEGIEGILKLSGKSVTIEVVNEVFSNFCVGK